MHRKRPLAVIAAAALMLGLPTYHLYLLSYNRIAGLLVLLWLTSPRPEPASQDVPAAQDRV